MWKRSELKKAAKQILKVNYTRAIAVCFLIAVLTGFYSETTDIISVYNKANEKQAVQIASGSDDIKALLDGLYDEYSIAHPDLPYIQSSFVHFVLNAANFVILPGSMIYMIINGFFTYFTENVNILFFLVLLGCLLKILYDIFFVAMLDVGQKRFFMEARCYKKTPISRIFYIFRYSRIRHVAYVLLVKKIFNFFWWFTIVGGVIKSYEYRMIPYILAENPNVSRKDAFRLSKEMMQNNKFNAFVLDLSFILWKVLNLFTVGLLRILFVNPYMTATNVELYMTLRDAMKAQSPELAAYFNDRYIEEPYQDEDTQTVAVSYPDAVFTLPVRNKISLLPVVPDRHYSLISYILMFFTFSVSGWIWEVTLHLVQYGTFVKRGVLTGPWLPIYGTGGVVVVFLLRKLTTKPILTFFTTASICTVIEYFTSWYLELTKGIRWWDYSGYFLNINGRVCLLGTVVFGIGGCAALYYFAPRLDDMYKKIALNTKLIICGVFCSVFIVDLIYSHYHPNMGEGITGYNYEENQETSVAYDTIDEGSVKIKL